MSKLSFRSSFKPAEPKKDEIPAIESKPVEAQINDTKPVLDSIVKTPEPKSFINSKSAETSNYAKPAQRNYSTTHSRPTYNQQNFKSSESRPIKPDYKPFDAKKDTKPNFEKKPFTKFPRTEKSDTVKVETVKSAPKKIFTNNKEKSSKKVFKKKEGENEGKKLKLDVKKKSNFFMTNDEVMKKFKKKARKEKLVRTATIFENITVKDLSHQLSEKSNVILKKLEHLGIGKVDENYALTLDTAEILVTELNHNYIVQRNDLNIDYRIQKIAIQSNQTRPPIVSIVGHVDHGKTSLIDYIQKTSTQEHGDITQSIRCFNVKTKTSEITFIDTPGHSIFSNLRESAIQASDIIVLIISATEGIKEQTIESIRLARGKRIIVAINKIDLLNSEEREYKVQKIQEKLLEYEVNTVIMGGEVICCEISAKKGIGIEDLFENIALIAENINLSYDPNATAYGKILDAQIDKHQGISASIVLLQGQLKLGDYIVTPSTFGKIKILNTKGEKTLKAGNSATIYQFEKSPLSQESFIVVESEREATTINDHYSLNEEDAPTLALSLKELIQKQQLAEEQQKLNLIIKSNSAGTLLSLVNEIQKIKSDTVQINIISKEIGEIKESDIKNAKYFNAEIISFHLKNSNSIKTLAIKEKIEIHEFNVIYHILEYIKDKIDTSKEEEIKKEILSRAKIKAIFEFSKNKIIGGCDILEGIFKRSNLVQILRNNVIIADNLSIKSMRAEKNEVDEGQKGIEIGFLFKDFNDLQKDDILESYKIVKNK